MEKIRRNMGPLHHSCVQHVRFQELLRTTSWSTEEGKKGLAVLVFTDNLPLSGPCSLQKNNFADIIKKYTYKNGCRDREMFSVPSLLICQVWDGIQTDQVNMFAHIYTLFFFKKNRVELNRAFAQDAVSSHTIQSPHKSTCNTSIPSQDGQSLQSSQEGRKLIKRREGLVENCHTSRVFPH